MTADHGTQLGPPGAGARGLHRAPAHDLALSRVPDRSSHRPSQPPTRPALKPRLTELRQVAPSHAVSGGAWTHTQADSTRNDYMIRALGFGFPLRKTGGRQRDLRVEWAAARSAGRDRGPSSTSPAALLEVPWPSRWVGPPPPSYSEVRDPRRNGALRRPRQHGGQLRPKPRGAEPPARVPRLCDDCRPPARPPRPPSHAVLAQRHRGSATWGKPSSQKGGNQDVRGPGLHSPGSRTGALRGWSGPDDADPPSQQRGRRGGRTSPHAPLRAAATPLQAALEGFPACIPGFRTRLL